MDKTRDFLIPEHKTIDIVFTDSLSIPLQTISLNLYFIGSVHSADNSLVWLPEDEILFGGCLLKSVNAKSIGNIADADLKAWPETVRKVRQKFSQAKTVIPGHMQIGDTAIFSHTLKILKSQ